MTDFKDLPALSVNTAEKIKFSVKDFFGKCELIHSLRQTCSHVLKKSLTNDFIFCSVKSLLLPKDY